MKTPSLMEMSTRNGIGVVAHVALTIAAMSLALTLSARGGATVLHQLSVGSEVLMGCAAIFVAYSFWRSGSSQAAIASGLMVGGLIAMVGGAFTKSFALFTCLAALAMALFIGAIVMFVRVIRSQ